MGKKVIRVAVGALHCLALTDKGEVYAWGDNDHYQQGNSSHACNKIPVKVTSKTLHIHMLKMHQLFEPIR